VRLDPWLKNHPKVEVIERYFKAGEYERRLAETDVMVLPYRAPYRLRVSRVLIEAITSGIPVIASPETTLWEQIVKYGAGVEYVEGSPDDLAQGIRKACRNIEKLNRLAQTRAEEARTHFSILTFRKKLQEAIL